MPHISALLSRQFGSVLGGRTRYLVLTRSDPQALSGRPRGGTDPCAGAHSYISFMSFEWDPGKARGNLRKHGVDFTDAVGALEDPWAATVSEPHPDEERYLTLGTDYRERLVVVTWTIRGDHVRILSARRATRSERRRYQGES